MAVGDIGILRVVGNFQSQNIVNSLHYEVTTQATSDLVLWDDLAAGWWSDFQAEWSARHSDAYTVEGIKVFTIKGDPHPPGVEIVNEAGAVIGDPQEAFIGRTITLYTESANHRNRGRLQLSGGVESMFDDTTGAVTATEVTAMSALIGQLLDGVITTDNAYSLVIYQRVLLTSFTVARAVARVTPSVVRSRRIKQFLIG